MRAFYPQHRQCSISDSDMRTRGIYAPSEAFVRVCLGDSHITVPFPSAAYFWVRSTISIAFFSSFCLTNMISWTILINPKSLAVCAVCGAVAAF